MVHTNTNPLASGYSASLTGTLANEGADSASANAPLRSSRGDYSIMDAVSNGLKHDPVYGPIPLTYYFGGGGGYYGGGGASISRTQISEDSTLLLPWHWSR